MEKNGQQTDPMVLSVREQRLEKNTLLALYFLFWLVLSSYLGYEYYRFLLDPEDYVRVFAERADSFWYFFSYAGALLFAVGGVALCFLKPRLRKWALPIHAGLFAGLMWLSIFIYALGYEW